MINRIKAGGDKANATVKQSTEEMTSIYKNASRENRNLTLTEKAQIAIDQQKK